MTRSCNSIVRFGCFIIVVCLLSLAQATVEFCPDSTSPSLVGAKDKIQQFLSNSNNDDKKSSSSRTNKFHIQGLRWHTMSLAREARRLQQLAIKLKDSDNDDDISDLKTAIDYTVGFNMKGLHKIERDLFFPWVRSKTNSKVESKDVVQAFDSVMDHLEKSRKQIENIGKELEKTVEVAMKSVDKPTQRERTVHEIAEKAKVIADYTTSMLQIEEAIIVPTIANIVSESEQKSFNNKVIRNLGILDSRLHLVGMYEAVRDNDTERTLFEQTIPSIPQMMIPRWKRLIYEPRAGVMDKA